MPYTQYPAQILIHVMQNNAKVKAFIALNILKPLHGESLVQVET